MQQFQLCMMSEKQFDYSLMLKVSLSFSKTWPETWTPWFDRPVNNLLVQTSATLQPHIPWSVHILLSIVVLRSLFCLDLILRLILYLDLILHMKLGVHNVNNTK